MHVFSRSSKVVDFGCDIVCRIDHDLCSCSAQNAQNLLWLHGTNAIWLPFGATFTPDISTPAFRRCRIAYNHSLRTHI